MSLVNEALKKANLEAHRARTESVAALVPKPAPKLYAPEVRKPKSRYVIALVAAGFTVALSATVLKVAATSSPHPASVPHAKTTATAAPTGTIQPRVSLPPPPEPSEGDTVSKEEVRVEPTGPIPRDLGKTEPISSNYEKVTESFTPAPVGIVEGKAYIQSIDLHGVPKLNLHGILWSDKPLAILNNITIAPGEELNDVTLIAIEPKRVKLRWQGKEFFIRLP